MTGLMHGEDKPDPIMIDGDVAYKTAHYDVAIAKYTEAIEKNPKNANAYTDRALAYKEKKDYDKAIADFNEALRLKPEAFVYYDRGVIYREMGAEDKAIADFTKALKLSIPNAQLRAECYIQRAHSYMNKENADKALPDLNAAIKMGTSESDAYVLRGVVHKVRHEYELSITDYEKAIALDPNEARAYGAEAFLLAVCPSPKHRDGKKAIAYATKACELTEWKNAQQLQALAAAYAETGQFDEAINFENKAGEIDPKSVDKKTLALYQQKQPRRELNRKDSERPFTNLANIEHKVVVKIGHKANAQFAVRGNQLVEPKIGLAGTQKPNSVWLDFGEDKQQRILFLWHSFPRTMKARCLARLKGYDTYFETDILPVPVKTISPEIWKEPIEELVLFDFKLTDSKRP
jgi:tetratricopeptide (TPR) repeat protein